MSGSSTPNFWIIRNDVYEYSPISASIWTTGICPNAFSAPRSRREPRASPPLIAASRTSSAFAADTPVSCSIVAPISSVVPRRKRTGSRSHLACPLQYIGLFAPKTSQTNIHHKSVNNVRQSFCDDGSSLTDIRRRFVARRSPLPQVPFGNSQRCSDLRRIFAPRLGPPLWQSDCTYSALE